MPSQGKKVVIVGAARTPIGAFLGSLASVPAPRLGATAIQAALQRAGVKPEDVKTVFMGEVLQGGVGQAPARQAALYAGIPKNVPCVTVNKVCGSGLESVIEGARVIALGEADVVVAGGMESMSNAPYFTHSARTGARMGNTELKDLMIHDGLWDPYNDMHMGMCGEKCAADFKFSRAAQDEYAMESTRRAQKAQAEGAFKAEIAPVEIVDRKGNKTVVADDEGPKLAKPDKISSLKALFNGTVKNRRLEGALLILHAVGYLSALLIVLSPLQAVAFLLVHQALFGVYLGMTFAPNHKGMPHPTGDEDFLRKQVLTSRNVRGGWLTDAALGGLNYQIEHHLFPGMPTPNLRKAQPIVQAYCAEVGVAYEQTGLIRSYRQALQHLHQVGAPARAEHAAR